MSEADLPPLSSTRRYNFFSDSPKSNRKNNCMKQNFFQSPVPTRKLSIPLTPFGADTFAPKPSISSVRLNSETNLLKEKVAEPSMQRSQRSNNASDHSSSSSTASRMNSMVDNSGYGNIIVLCPHNSLIYIHLMFQYHWLLCFVFFFLFHFSISRDRNRSIRFSIGGQSEKSSTGNGFLARIEEARQNLGGLMKSYKSKFCWDATSTRIDFSDNMKDAVRRMRDIRTSNETNELRRELKKPASATVTSQSSTSGNMAVSKPLRDLQNMYARSETHMSQKPNSRKAFTEREVAKHISIRENNRWLRSREEANARQKADAIRAELVAMGIINLKQPEGNKRRSRVSVGANITMSLNQAKFVRQELMRMGYMEQNCLTESFRQFQRQRDGTPGKRCIVPAMKFVAAGQNPLNGMPPKSRDLERVKNSDAFTEDAAPTRTPYMLSDTYKGFMKLQEAHMPGTSARLAANGAFDMWICHS